MGSDMRLIDKEPSKPRTREMRLLNFGYCRTGTNSMYTALQKLDLHPFHMVEAIQRPQTLHVWQEALRAHYLKQGKPFGREEFDKLLGDFDSLLDVPPCLLVDELLAAYPDAKVLLTERNADSWMGSMDRTLWTVMSWGGWDTVAPWHPVGAGIWSLMKCIKGCWADEQRRKGCDLKQVYLDHYAYVKKAVPKERLLCHKPQDGWEPLCKFLDSPVPDEPYPNVNDTANWIRIHSQLWWICLASMLGKTVLAPAAVAGAAGLWWYKFR